MKESCKKIEDLCSSFDLLIYGESEIQMSNVLRGDKRTQSYSAAWIFG